MVATTNPERTGNEALGPTKRSPWEICTKREETKKQKVFFEFFKNFFQVTPGVLTAAFSPAISFRCHKRENFLKFILFQFILSRKVEGSWGSNCYTWKSVLFWTSCSMQARGPFLQNTLIDGKKEHLVHYPLKDSCSGHYSQLKNYPENDEQNRWVGWQTNFRHFLVVYLLIEVCCIILQIWSI